MTFIEKIDSAIGAFSPSWALKRTKTRTLVTLKKLQGERAVEAFSQAYDGARSDRSNQGWLTDGGSADADIIENLPALRSRTRDLEQSNGRVAGIVKTLLDNVIGTGIRPEPIILESALGIEEGRAREIEEELKEFWRAFVPRADASRKCDFYGLQRQSLWAQIVNGESLYLPQSIADPNSPVSLKLFGVESDRLETPTDKVSSGLVHGGIQVGARYGEPQKYFFMKRHPGDEFMPNQPSTEFFAISAEDRFGRKLVLHTFDQTRSGQSRGVPLFAPVLKSIFDQQRYLEAERIAALLSACIGLIINDSSGNTGQNGLLTTLDGKTVEDFGPGMVWRGNGLEITQINNQRPGDNFAAFIKDIDRTIANACGMAYELAMKDYSNANYSTLRAALVDARRGFAVDQKRNVHFFCQPTWEMFVDELVLSGKMDLPKYFENRNQWLKVLWVPHGHDWIDPDKEVKAAKNALEIGITTLKEVIAGRNGGNVRDTIKQRGIEKKLMESEGLIVEPAEPEQTPATETNPRNKEDNDES